MNVTFVKGEPASVKCNLLAQKAYKNPHDCKHLNFRYARK